VFLVAEVCIILLYVISVLLPLNLADLVDEVLYKRDYSKFLGIGMKYLIMFVGAASINFTYAFVWQYLNNHFVLDIKNRMFDLIIHSRASFLSKINSGDILTRIDGDADQYIHAVLRNGFHFINSAFMCVGILILVARTSIVMSILLLIAAIVPIIISKLSGKIVEKYAQESRKESGKLTGLVFDLIKGIREIKLTCAEKWAESKCVSLLKKIISFGNKTIKIEFFVGEGTDLVNLVTTLGIYGYSLFLVLRGQLTVGVFLACLQYINLLRRKLNWMLRIYLDWFTRKVSVDRVTEILELTPERTTGDKINAISSIEFKNVFFKYEEDNPVLNDVSFNIHRGEKIGIVGESGNGKTTILSLIMGFYSIISGELLINQIPIEQIDVYSLRRRIGVISQDIVIFEDTIRFNLTLGDDYPDSELMKVLSAVGLENVIIEMPDGIDTVIGSDNRGLSGGQKQKLMIARVLLRNPDLLIMDEATSAIDAESEKELLNYISENMKETTILQVSHRLETIQSCDRIMVINNHGIESIGSHDELNRRSKTYRQLFGSLT